MLERQAEDDVAIFEGFYLFLGVEFRDQVYLILGVSVIETSFSFDAQFHELLRVDVLGLYQKTHTKLRDVFINLQFRAFFHQLFLIFEKVGL